MKLFNVNDGDNDSFVWAATMEEAIAIWKENQKKIGSLRVPPDSCLWIVNSEDILTKAD